jgi:hypothetical protein
MAAFLYAYLADVTAVSRNGFTIVDNIGAALMLWLAPAPVWARYFDSPAVVKTWRRIWLPALVTSRARINISLHSVAAPAYLAADRKINREID